MKTWAILVPVAVLTLGTAVMAQEAQPESDVPALDQPMDEGASTGAPQDDGAIKPVQEANEMVGSWLIGTVVMSESEENVGEIKDIVVNLDSGEISGVVASVGGFLGIGAKAIAIDWDRLTIDYDGYQVTTDLTRTEADAAPEYQFRDREVPPPTPGMVENPEMGGERGVNMDEPTPPSDPKAETAPVG